MFFIKLMRPWYVNYNAPILKYQSSEGRCTISLETLMGKIDYRADCYIPAIWPIFTDSAHGPVCGLVALSIALKYNSPHRLLPPINKNGRRGIVSWRRWVKEQKLSTIGAIYDGHHMATIANHFGSQVYTALQPTADTYLSTICNLLTERHTVTVACEINPYFFPESVQGHRTHWALIFAYYYSLSKELFFIVIQYDGYYIWKADDLLQSNQQMPDRNPRVGPTYFYGKCNGQHGTFPFPANEIPDKKIYDNTPLLTRFRFSLLPIPVHANYRQKIKMIGNKKLLRSTSKISLFFEEKSTTDRTQDIEKFFSTYGHDDCFLRAIKHNPKITDDLLAILEKTDPTHISQEIYTALINIATLAYENLTLILEQELATIKISTIDGQVVSTAIYTTTGYSITLFFHYMKILVDILKVLPNDYRCSFLTTENKLEEFTSALIPFRQNLVILLPPFAALFDFLNAFVVSNHTDEKTEESAPSNSSSSSTSVLPQL